MKVPEDREMHYGLMPRSEFYIDSTPRKTHPYSLYFHYEELAGGDPLLKQRIAEHPLLNVESIFPSSAGIEPSITPSAAPSKASPREEFFDTAFDWKVLVAVGVVAVLCLLIFVL